ncbi:uncharacterized protein [Miscanthus floridulus]|uniref:uncharacterized protein isoform X1 n=1 Tax=Miscanthus floridulus TaxID=154761 RepID=UPI0034588732
MAPPAASISPVCCVPFPASAPRRASPSSLRRLPRFAARSSGGGGGTRPEPKPDDNESKAVLDAFFLGKAFAEALTERVESVVGEVFSVVGQWQAEQQKQVQEFQKGNGSAFILGNYIVQMPKVKCDGFVWRYHIDQLFCVIIDSCVTYSENFPFRISSFFSSL